MLGQYQNNFGIKQLKVVNRVIKYLQDINNNMFMYTKLYHYKIIDYSNSYFIGPMNSGKSIFRYIFLLAIEVRSCKTKKKKKNL